jgi:AcrR family transcriptional regulator
MKLLFDSLDALLTQLRDRHVDVVHVSPALAIETGPRTSDVPRLVSRVLVTAALDDHHWAEWRHWVGQAIADLESAQIQIPAALREQRDHALAEISRRVDDAGFQIREGILTHDAGVMDSFRL